MCTQTLITKTIVLCKVLFISLYTKTRVGPSYGREVITKTILYVFLLIYEAFKIIIENDIIDNK